ncbi:hypothetical protein [Rhodoblastus sp.]|uniref:hypothetical protein n=1 Tax=Rhodoblastus sp. TaxID=1962975 RepID=UPI002633A10F|nr:hypothetical protein [Rhodoblastus sp.]
MSQTKFIGRAAAAAFLAAGVVASVCDAAEAQDAGQQPTMFGYAAPHQFLINRMLAPDQPESDGNGGPAAGQGASAQGANDGGQAGNAGQAAADNGGGAGNGYYRFPKRYLLNKMFDFGGGDSAPAPATAAPAPAAAAAKTP